MEEHRNRLRFIMLMTTVFAALATLSFGLGFSHRVVGPVYRVRKHIRRIVAGEEMGDIKLRQGDFFQELADAFNEYHRTRSSGTGLRRQPRAETANRRRGAASRSGSDG